MEIKSILLGASFAPSFVKALSLAKGIAEKFGGKLYIYKAYKTPAHLFYSYGSTFYTRNMENEREELSEMLDNVIDEQTQDIRDRVEVIDAGFENPVKALLRLANEKHPDLLIIGHHEESDVEKLLVGDNLPTLVEQAPCYVMVAKSEHVGAEAERRLAA